MTSRHRILQLTFHPESSIDRVISEYRRALVPDRYHLTVAYLFGAPVTGLKERLGVDEMVFLNCPRRELLGLRREAIVRLRELLAMGFDAILVHRYMVARWLVLAHIGQRLPPRWLVLHEFGIFTGPQRRLRRWLLAGWRFIAISRAVASDLPLALQQHTTTILNSIDVAAHRQALLSAHEARVQLGLPPNSLVFSSVGRLISFKNHAALIRAFARARLPEHARLVIVGGGRLEAELRRLAHQERIASRVVFCGHQPQAARLMTAFDVFVLPSVGEPFGLVLLEAMVAERPIVTTALGGAAEVVGDFALSVDEASPTTLAAALEAAAGWSPNERRRRGQAGLAHVERHFATSRLPTVLKVLPDPHP